MAVNLFKTLPPPKPIPTFTSQKSKKVINAVVAVWAAPAVSASDFTQNAHSFREQALGQTLGLVVAYILFAVAGVCIIAGASIHYGADTWNVLDIVQRWDSLFASFFAVLVILMTTISSQKSKKVIKPGRESPNRVKSPPRVKNPGQILPIRIKQASDPA